MNWKSDTPFFCCPRCESEGEISAIGIDAIVFTVCHKCGFIHRYIQPCEPNHYEELENRMTEETKKFVEWLKSDESSKSLVPLVLANPENIQHMS